jgi:hypothetical protein
MSKHPTFLMVESSESLCCAQSSRGTVNQYATSFARPLMTYPICKTRLDRTAKQPGFRQILKQFCDKTRG